MCAGSAGTRNPDTTLVKRRGLGDFSRTHMRTRKTKRPRLDLSLGTFVDQPSPKCCSRKSIDSQARVENGTSVLSHCTVSDSPGQSLLDDPRRSNPGSAGRVFLPTFIR